MVNEREKVAGNSIVIRLLNSVLKGCEFVLEPGSTLFLVSDNDAIRAQQAGSIQPENMIFIPMNKGGVNFELIIATDDSPVLLRELGSTDKNIVREIEFNRITTIGCLHFAAKKVSDCWEESIFTHFATAEIMTKTNAISFEKRNRNWLLFFVFIIVFCALAMLGYNWLTSQQRKVTEISTLLGAQKSQYQIISARDHALYIFSASENEMNWAKQAVIRMPVSTTVHVSNLAGEESLITLWLKESWPKVKIHRVRMDNARQPIVLFSAERGKLDMNLQRELEDQLKKQFPYVEKVIFNSLNDSVVVKQAEESLSKFSIPYSKKTNSNSVTFVISGSIDDGELQRMKKVVEDFYLLWGDQYVQFAIELKNDWLKGKSFKYGENGYVKISPGHWYFPQPLNKSE